MPNPFMPDTPQRIATDTSQKLPIRFGETIKSYLQHPELKLSNLVVIPMVFAGWCRYLMGVDDAGESFTPSADPLLETMQQLLSGVQLEEPSSREKPSSLFSPTPPSSALTSTKLEWPQRWRKPSLQ